MSAAVNDNSPQANNSSMPIEFVSVSKPAQIAVVAQLARDIWYDHYVPLIGRPQVDYMVRKFQTAAAIEAQMRDGYEYFLAVRDGCNVGYLAVQAQPPEQMFISKFYVTKEARGTGTGRTIMEFIVQAARSRGLSRLWLTVNKGNPAVRAYERLGFHIAEAIAIDIGEGFVMDDFRMERNLT